MRIETIFSWIFFLVGTVGIIYSIRNSDPMLLAESSILWIGMLFFEMLIIKDDLKEKFKDIKK